jgi:1-acyl-sn-glycerol-3-phosphate acyltransferase
VRGVALEIAAFVLVTALLPALLAGGALVDAALWLRSRKPWMAVRLTAFLWWFLLGEMRGLSGLLFLDVTSGFRDTPRRRRGIYRLRQMWTGHHLAGVRTLFGVGLEVEGLEHAGPGPIVMLIRHASIIDNTLPDAIVGRRHGIGFRFVLKRELEFIPCIDIGGRWVPTTFVRRGSGDSERELERVKTLAVDLGPDEGILIYPEGTRATATKLARAQAVIQERQPEIAPLANRLKHLLPPRLGGPLVLLEGARGADVVICGHVGLDGFEYVSDIWAGGLVGTTIRMRFWRFPAAEVPTDRDAMVKWLYDRWQELDDWIGEQKAAGNVVLGPKAMAEEIEEVVVA